MLKTILINFSLLFPVFIDNRSQLAGTLKNYAILGTKSY